jgi:hypothetical protein
VEYFEFFTRNKDFFKKEWRAKQNAQQQEDIVEDVREDKGREAQ